MTLKTQANDASVGTFIAGIQPQARQQDCLRAREIMERLTGEPAVMWGDAIVGFGRYDYRYASGHSGSWFLTGFAPRKQNFTLYIMSGFTDLAPQLQQLGRHKTAKSCLYLRSMDEVDRAVLEEIISYSLEVMRRRYPAT